MSQLLHQADLDVERLRKAADRMDAMRARLREVTEQRAAAAQALKTIHIWAMNVQSERDIEQIADRAMDALRLMGEK